VFNRTRWNKLKAMTPAQQWWEKRYIASGYVRGDGTPADRDEVLRLIEWAIKRHKQQDRREERSNREQQHSRYGKAAH
jgi:hypothetical protein